MIAGDQMMKIEAGLTDLKQGSKQDYCQLYMPHPLILGKILIILIKNIWAFLFFIIFIEINITIVCLYIELNNNLHKQFQVLCQWKNVIFLFKKKEHCMFNMNFLFLLYCSYKYYNQPLYIIEKWTRLAFTELQDIVLYRIVIYRGHSTRYDQDQCLIIKKLSWIMIFHY